MNNGHLRLVVVVLAFTASGATCNRQWLPTFTSAVPTAPVVLTPGAQVPEIAAAINQNSARVQSLSAPYATITVPDAGALVPPLRGNIALERPQRFRLTAGTGLSGQEVDLGSNNERFWLWVKRNQPPRVYLCRHDQFARSAAHQLMPIEPRWLHSALGLVELDPLSVYQGPTVRGDGSIELQTHLPSLAGPLRRVLVIDPQYGWVREQHVYDASGQNLIASAVAHSHHYDEVAQVSLPEQVTIRLPPAQIAFTVDLGQVQINQPPANPAQLWSMPAFEGYEQVDLGTVPPNMILPVGKSVLGQSAPPGYPPSPGGQLGGGQVRTPEPAQPFGRLRRIFSGRWRRDANVQPAGYVR